jgi:hypothetical protein
MTINKNTFDYIKGMINNKESVKSIIAYCEGFGIDVNGSSTPVHISDNKITITYRRNNYYVSYNHSVRFGTTYFNKI